AGVIGVAVAPAEEGPAVDMGDSVPTGGAQKREGLVALKLRRSVERSQGEQTRNDVALRKLGAVGRIKPGKDDVLARLVRDNADHRENGEEPVVRAARREFHQTLMREAT